MMRQDCKTQYPIVLAHGLGFPDEGARPYWGRIPDVLRENGARVYFGGQDAWGTIGGNARQLAVAVRDAMRAESAARVNLIAHSKGGLEARRLISSMGLGGCVASLSMLSTPNRGAPMSEMLLRLHPGIELWSAAAERGARRRGDRHPSVLRAGREITAAALARFNRENPDDSRVYYQSWGARLNGLRADPLMDFSRRFVDRRAGEGSDGLVTPSSARWGRYRGTLEGVSHQMLADAFGRDIAGFDVRGFYTQLVHELAEMGF
ncbi:MAG: hypothetical protein Q4C72_02800 [Eubacteriales bacterium]|nr:hypothetical protein [Eubacteriales bacterium]